VAWDTTETMLREAYAALEGALDTRKTA